MDKTLLLLIFPWFCFGICIISGKKGSEVDLKVSPNEATNNEQVDTTVNKEFHYNVSELKETRVEGECKCKNGKCMRMCDLKKTTPCLDERMVCICNPEFGKTDDFECEYCDCGQGFNCTFKRPYDYYRARKCDCPKGYYEVKRPGYFNSRCEAECGDDYERYCENGGFCNWHDNRCSCPPGTSGPLCEEVLCSSQCANRLEVDCLFDWRKRTSYCGCKNSSLYFDYDANICKPCPCGNGECEYEISYLRNRLKCKCHSGYKEFNGYCKKCQCDFRAIGECEFDSEGERICKCPDGYYERNGYCLLCGCTQEDVLNTKCEMIGNVKRCFCKEGFQDISGYCEDIDECEKNNRCHPSANCINTEGSFRCECPGGYAGINGRNVEPEEVCKDIDECEESPNPCYFWDNVKCVNIPGSYKCECFQGYNPSSNFYEPHKTTCIRTKKHWGPSVIVICTTLVLIAALLFVRKLVRNRAARSN